MNADTGKGDAKMKLLIILEAIGQAISCDAMHGSAEDWLRGVMSWSADFRWGLLLPQPVGIALVGPTTIRR
jgi:hypothetical protein